MRKFLASLVVVCAAVAIPVPHAYAATCSAISGTGEVESDFDGDGYQDLAVGSPEEDDGSLANAGAVQVIYGSSSGLTANADRLFTQNTAGIPGSSEPYDAWGATLASGDFNNDGYCDLAIAAPYEDESNAYDAGRVTVLYGSSIGLRTAGAQSFGQSTTGVADSPQTSDEFGRGLAAGQFGRGRATDLAIGVPREDFGGITDAGMVHVLYGTDSGLTTTGSRMITQNSSGILNSAQQSDMFGAVLAAGNIGKSSYADLIVGLPNESISTVGGAGGIHLIYGSADGLGTADAFIHQESEGILGDPVTDGHFGYSVAIANVGKSATNDIAIGVPGATVGGDEDAGQVQVIYCNDDGTTTVDELWSQDSPDVPDDAEVGDLFGSRIAAGNLGKSGQADLAISAPEEDGATLSAIGAVTVMYGSTTGLTAADSIQIDQDGTDDAGETGERWSNSGLLIRNFGDGAHADLIVGAQGEQVGAGPAEHGAIQVFYGSSTGVTESDSELWHPDTEGIVGANESNDRWGWVGNNSWGA